LTSDQDSREAGGARHGWPAGRRFAFTIVDDTEGSTVENAGPVYALLAAHGLLTTKTVWPVGFRRTPRFGGGTLEDPGYRAWVLALAEAGFEIALHGATDHTSTREETLVALERFREYVGAYPRVHANHFGQAEALYWGEARLDGLPRFAYRARNTLLRSNEQYYGHVEGSPYFWGDICRERIDYVRNFTFPTINTGRADPLMPYHDARRPYVNYWFSSSDAPTVDSFCELLSEDNQDRLVREGGACIVYTHFGFGFAQDGRVEPRVAHLLERLAALPGWFVPASTLLDHLRAQPDWRAHPAARQIASVQWRWLRARLQHGRL
jgi:hypothetical protein